MRVIEPRQIPRPRLPKSKHRATKWFAIFGAVLMVAYLGIFAVRYTRPLPVLQPESKNIVIPASLKPLDLPIYGQVAAGAVGYGQLAKAGESVPKPIASVAKVLTALTVLEKKPLAVGQQGPNLTLDATDVAYYNDFVSRDGSVVAVKVGEEISEYQALQALLLPSANNMADSLARWAFGSQEEFIKAANEYANTNGLKQTSLADASGFSPKSVSTATDLVLLGELAVKNAVVAEIASQSSATIPVAGTITNVNVLLGKDGIDGIKTGNTDEAGGCYLTSVLYKHPSGEQVRLIVAVMGAGTLAQAMQDARGLLTSVTKDFEVAKIPAGTVVGYYNEPWGSRITAVTKSDLQILKWQGTPARAETVLDDIRVTAKPQETGTTTLSAGPKKSESKVVLSRQVSMPSWRWRFWRAVAL